MQCCVVLRNKRQRLRRQRAPVPCFRRRRGNGRSQTGAITAGHVLRQSDIFGVFVCTTADFDFRENKTALSPNKSLRPTCPCRVDVPARRDSFSSYLFQFIFSCYVVLTLKQPLCERSAWLDHVSLCDRLALKVERNHD